MVSVVASCLAVGCGGGNPNESVGVPNLIGDKVEDAESRLEDLDLRWRFVLRFSQTKSFSEVFSERDPAPDADPNVPDRVLKQAPAPGVRVTPGTVVTLETQCATGCG